MLDGVQGESLPCNRDEGTTEASGYSKHRCCSDSKRLYGEPDCPGVVKIQPVGKRFVTGERVWLDSGHQFQVCGNVPALLGSRREPTLA